ncbi:MAG: hypothetical protein ACTS8S_04875, partial [Giesbergeria sp.]
MKTATHTQVEYTHEVTYKGIKRLCNQENYKEVSDELIKELGEGEIPDIKPINRQIVTAPIVTAPTAAAPPAPPKLAQVVQLNPPVRGGEVDLIGKLRATADQHLAEELGFSVAPPIYAIGTRVLEIGVDNARQMQVEHDKKPPAQEVARQLVRLVQAEQRYDLPAQLTRDLRLDKTGELRVAGGPVLKLDERGFGSLVTRLPCVSGATYLANCPADLRAHNFNHWTQEIARLEHADSKRQVNKVVLRTRKSDGGGREVFAAVSEKYSAFDADKIGEALAIAFPADARGSLNYDGHRVRIEGLWRTDIAPEEFVAGEIFKAGVIIRADDTGSGSIRVQSVIWRNLCLNLIILDKAIGVDIRLRHMGEVRKLARAFQVAFQKALASIEPFRRAWGAAMEERGDLLVQRAAGTTSESIEGRPVSEVLPGLFLGTLDRELVKVSGRKKDVVKKLVELHAQDERAVEYGYSRASIVNAFTRYAHEVEEDPFAADVIREGAGK